MLSFWLYKDVQNYAQIYNVYFLTVYFSLLCEVFCVSPVLPLSHKAERSLRHRRRHGEGTAARCRYEPLGWSQWQPVHQKN